MVRNRERKRRRVSLSLEIEKGKEGNWKEGERREKRDGVTCLNTAGSSPQPPPSSLPPPPRLTDGGTSARKNGMILDPSNSFTLRFSLHLGVGESM